MITLLVLLSIKHFLADFAYQPPYQWQNKGTWGHPGGIVHAGQHAILSLIILLFFINPVIAVALAILEFVVHYHIDWAKMSINRHYVGALLPTISSGFSLVSISFCTPLRIWLLLPTSSDFRC